jgi:chemotaxis protein MotB
MALGRKRRDRGGLDAWPGYVDALATLLMVIIFVLLVFVLAQGFVSVLLSSRDQALDRLNRQVSELGELLALERGQSQELRTALARGAEELRATAAARETAQRSLALLREERDRLASDRDTTRADRDRLSARITDLEAAARGSAARVADLETRRAEALGRAEAAGTDAARTTRTLTDTQRQLAAESAGLQALRRDLGAERETRAARERDLAASQAQGEALARDLAAARQALAAAQRDIAALREEAARLDRTVQADRATIEMRLSDIARLQEQLRALQALRDQLERQAASALARAGQEEGARRAAEAQAGEFARLSDSARAQVALLTRELEALRTEIGRLSAALNLAEAEGRDRDAQITLLGQRLNAALAARVEELQSYRSDFFGRLRRVVGDRPEVRIVGDRFVFQSEVLFPVGSAELSANGQQQLRELARLLEELTRQIPPDIGWVLRVDGHADRTPLGGRGRFASNWELSAARALAVAQLLIAEGLPANRVAATAFGDTQPLDDRDTPEAYARNRRIELRLTDR